MYYYDDEENEEETRISAYDAMSKADMEEWIDEISTMLNKYSPVGDDELLDDGQAYYMNANDGTDFDWECNYRTCEFMKFYKNEMGAIKLMVYNNGNLEGYKWSGEGYGEATEIVIEDFMTRHEALRFAAALMLHFDYEAKWDAAV